MLTVKAVFRSCKTDDGNVLYLSGNEIRYKKKIFEWTSDIDVLLESEYSGTGCYVINYDEKEITKEVDKWSDDESHFFCCAILSIDEKKYIIFDIDVYIINEAGKTIDHMDCKSN